MELTKTIILWWRYGREHGEGEFRANPVELTAAYLQEKAAGFREAARVNEAAGGPWRWWQIDENLIVEKPVVTPGDCIFSPHSWVYYLLNEGIAVIEAINSRSGRWKWYIHIADHEYSPENGCWLMKDLFCDVVVGHDDRDNLVLDLDELALALDLGLLTPEKISEILRRVNRLVRRIAEGEFPFPEIQRGREARAQWEQNGVSG